MHGPQNIKNKSSPSWRCPKARKHNLNFYIQNSFLWGKKDKTNFQLQL